MSRKLIAFVLVGVLCVGAGIGIWLAVRVPRDMQLRFLNWGQFIDESLIDDFETWYRQQPGIHRRFRVDIAYYTSNDGLYNMITTGGRQVDLIVPSDYMLERLIRENRVQPLDMSLLPSITRSVEGGGYEFDPEIIDPAITGPVTGSTFRRYGDPANVVYGIPYMYGTMGILYDTRVVDIELLERYGWALLWANDPEITPSLTPAQRTQIGQVSMKDIGRENHAVAQFARLRADLLEVEGQERLDMINERVFTVTNQADIDVARDFLLRQPANTRYEPTGDDRMSDIFEGNATQAIGSEWSVNAVWAMKVGEESRFFEYFIPEEGTNLWINTMAIPRNANSASVAHAHAFINFINNRNHQGRDIPAQNMQAIGGTSPIISSQLAVFEYFYNESTMFDARPEQRESLLEAWFPGVRMGNDGPVTNTAITGRSGTMRSFSTELDDAISAMMLDISTR